MDRELSVIIPVLNEGPVLGRALAALAAQGPELEVMVVDAGSTDETRQVAEANGAMVIESPVRQRARQMNLGAAEAAGKVLWFVHADTKVPPGSRERIREALRSEGVAGGAFARQFESDSEFLWMTCALAEARNRAVGWHLGDQAMFVRRELFERLGGFAEYDRFEDLDFSRRLSRIGKVVTLRPPVVTSARRFKERGAAGQTMRDFWLTLRYLSGSRAAIYRSPAGPARAGKDDALGA